MNFIKASAAVLFRILFKIPFFRGRYYGFHKRIFQPYHLFAGVKKQIYYRENILLNVNLDDWIQQQVYFLGEYEKAETDYLYHVLKPGDTFIDIGANIGLFSLNASKIVGNSGKVYSFEAFKPNYIQFKKHIVQNKIQNIKAENKAVSNDSTPIEIRYILRTISEWHLLFLKNLPLQKK